MSQGYQAALGIDTVQPVTRGYEFEACTLAQQGAILDTSGIRGTRSHLAARTRAGLANVSGLLQLVPSADDLARLLPWILGTPASGNTYALSESVAERYVQIDKVAHVCNYAGCCVQRATFACAVGEPLRLQLELLAKSETVASACSFPSVTYASGAPFLFSDTTLTLLDEPREVRAWSVVIEQHLIASHYNGTTPTRIMSRDRTVTLQTTHPYTADEVDLGNQAASGAAATLTLVGPGHTLGFQFAALQCPPPGVLLRGRDEIVLELAGVARRVGNTAELIVTLS